MANAAMGAALRHLQTIYDGGTTVGLTDAELLQRFVDRGDEPAFATLVARHGPMVLAVARGVLRDAHDAEDAFQATFLILARKARGIRRREVLAGWLHRVAHRVAVEAATRAGRRQQGERQAAATAATMHLGPPSDAPGPILHEELTRLPERFRLPLVLCHLEGLTHAQAAARLRLGEATVRRRLAGAKDLLRSRLTRRGVVPATGLAVLEAVRPASAAVPEALARAAIRAATTSGVVPATVAILATGITRGMLMTRLATLGAATMTLTTLVGLTAFAIGDITDREPPTDPPPPPAVAPRPQPVAEPPEPVEDGEQIVVRGRVVDPEGRPVAGAEVYLGGIPRPESLTAPFPPGRANSDAEGRFRVETSRHTAAVEAGSWFGMPLSALAEGFGPAWVRFDPEANGADTEWVLTLATDDVPITGRLLDLEGRPVPGATVRVHNLMRPAPDDLDALLDDLRENAGRMNPDLWGRLRDRLAIGDGGVLPETATDAEGRFRLDGIGRGRIAVLWLEADSIETAHALALTTDDPDFEPIPMPEGGSGNLQGARVEITAPPGRVVEGVIRDRDTGAPLEGISVVGHFTAQSTTDADGRYRLGGLPAAMPVQVRVAAGDQPYLAVEAMAPSPAGLAPANLDFALKRCVWVDGRVVNAATGDPVVGALVGYFPMRDNPHLDDVPGSVLMNNAIGDEPEVRTDADGRFRVAALPGGGLIAVQSADRAFLTAEPLDPQVATNVLRALNVPFSPEGYEGLALVNPPTDVESIACEVALRPGRALRGVVVGPDGEPMADGREIRLETHIGTERLPDGLYSIIHPHPGQAETIVYHHPDRDLGGFLDVTGEEEEILRLELEPTGTVAGRLVDEDGRPQPDVELQVLCHTSGSASSRPHMVPNTTTDSDGRFRIGKLIPGLKYQILALKPRRLRQNNYDADGYIAHDQAWWSVEPGEVQAWGDVTTTRIGGD